MQVFFVYLYAVFTVTTLRATLAVKPEDRDRWLKVTVLILLCVIVYASHRACTVWVH